MEVQQRERGLQQPIRFGHVGGCGRVGESRALLGTVDLRVHVGECVPAPFGVVVLDRFAQALRVRAESTLAGGSTSSEINRGKIRGVARRSSTQYETVDLGIRLMGGLGNMRAPNLLGRAAVLRAAVSSLAA